MKTDDMVRFLTWRLSTTKIPHDTEWAMQRAVNEMLAAFGPEFGFTHVREARLSSKDVVDFLVGGVAIECKVSGQPMAIYRQLQRYLKHDRIEAIILLTSRHMGKRAEDKNIHVVHVGKAWL